jgi:TPR repeat protein
VKAILRRMIALVLLVVPLAGLATTPEEAALIRQSAERGNHGAQVLLGLIYRHGDAGYPRDANLSAYWMLRAARQGNAYAEERMGEYYAQGIGVAKDLRQAAHWRELAAAQGRSEALGLFHAIAEIGRNLIDIYQSGEALTEKALAGDSEAQYELGLRYETGAWGVEQDGKAAVLWLTRAAEGGHRLAMQALAHIHEKGLHGVPADADAARAWNEKLRAADDPAHPRSTLRTP